MREPRIAGTRRKDDHTRAARRDPAPVLRRALESRTIAAQLGLHRETVRAAVERETAGVRPSLCRPVHPRPRICRSSATPWRSTRGCAPRGSTRFPDGRGPRRSVRCRRSDSRFRVYRSFVLGFGGSVFEVFLHWLVLRFGFLSSLRGQRTRVGPHLCRWSFLFDGIFVVRRRVNAFVRYALTRNPFSDTG